ncbi:hypothetical protein [Nocardia bovistercoris]|uniref:Uncharacterized protein n=1 Tax=Nocardia bovistercoris TaxID=2785916 RepID=A0A931ICU0_9NOCA|nr:hypothetical protein [Nocardia bovistercoris]MBH0778781.1 hypothetical protein [Nocardia bovistercoris]
MTFTEDFWNGTWYGGTTSDGRGGTATWVDAACPDTDTNCELRPMFCFATPSNQLGVYRLGRAEQLAEIHKTHGHDCKVRFYAWLFLHPDEPDF